MRSLVMAAIICIKLERGDLSIVIVIFIALFALATNSVGMFIAIAIVLSLTILAIEYVRRHPLG